MLSYYKGHIHLDKPLTPARCLIWKQSKLGLGQHPLACSCCASADREISREGQVRLRPFNRHAVAVVIHGQVTRLRRCEGLLLLALDCFHLPAWRLEVLEPL